MTRIALTKNASEDQIITIAESFYNVNYGSSIITSKSPSKISVIKTNTSVFVVFKTKCELKCQNEFFFVISSQVFVLITEIF